MKNKKLISSAKTMIEFSLSQLEEAIDDKEITSTDFYKIADMWRGVAYLGIMAGINEDDLKVYVERAGELDNKWKKSWKKKADCISKIELHVDKIEFSESPEEKRDLVRGYQELRYKFKEFISTKEEDMIISNLTKRLKYVPLII